MGATLQAPHILEFPYTRSTGPVVGAFLTGLRDGRLLGVKAADGRVLLPPQEYDPDTAEELSELVEVATTGTVVTWSWNPEPKHGQPLDVPFAWALVQFEGADTPMLHALAVGSPDEVETGMAVRIRWAAARRGAITDIACVEPDPDGAGAASAAPNTNEEAGDEPVTVTTAPMRIDMDYVPGEALEQFLLGTQRRELLGRRCSECEKVYLPPRGVCTMCGAHFTDEQVTCGPDGTVTTFLIVNVPFASQEVEIPYTAVEVLFDNADTTAQFLLRGASVDEVRMGMRVRAIWSDAEDLQPTLSNITHVEPLDEPDVPFDDFAIYV